MRVNVWEEGSEERGLLLEGSDLGHIVYIQIATAELLGSVAATEAAFLQDQVSGRVNAEIEITKAVERLKRKGKEGGREEESGFFISVPRVPTTVTAVAGVPEALITNTDTVPLCVCAVLCVCCVLCAMRE